MESLVSGGEPRIQGAEGRLDPANEYASSSTPLFDRKIKFHPARKPFNGFIKSLDGNFKIETLNPGPDQKRQSAQVSTQMGAGGRKPNGSDLWDTGLDPELSFSSTFRKIVKIGAGLENLGNTCFLNSVLQCLTYTEPLAAYLQSGKHQNSCHIAGFCALCAIQKHVSRALQATGRILAPKDLVSNLRCISRNFRNSRQEDAHEYMVNLLESMHKCCLPSGVPSESPTAYEKSLVHKIFGGQLRSQVRCMQCRHCSDKFDPFLDLSLEIVKADTLTKALVKFTDVELLDGGEKQYQCERCKQKVKAVKQLTVHKAPHVLTIHLKRFHAHNPGQKIDKKIQFGPTLDMGEFVSGTNEGDLKYTLYGVLVHCGWSTHSGHYYCFVRTSSGMWYSLDDNTVVQVSERTVLDQKAYMLFYVRDRRNVAPRKPIDILQIDNLKANVSRNQMCSIVNQNHKEQLQKGPIENKRCGPGTSAALIHKNVVSPGSSKEILVKEASSEHNNGQVVAECLVPKADSILKSSSNLPLLKDPSQAITPLNPVVGKSMQPSYQSVITNVYAFNIGNAMVTADAEIRDCKENRNSQSDVKVSVQTSPNCVCPQQSVPERPVANDTSEEIGIVSNAGLANILPSENSNKALKRIPGGAPSEDSSDKMLEKVDLIKSPMKTSGGKNQVVDAFCDDPSGINSASGNSPNEKGQDCGENMIELSTISIMATKSSENKAPDSAPQRKSKKKLRINNMQRICLKFFRSSLGLHMKKKLKRTKRCTLQIHNIPSELLSDKDGLLTDLGPSTSEKSSRPSACSTHSQKKKGVNHTAHKSVNSSMIDQEFNERICLNGAVLATDYRADKSSGPTLEATKSYASETYILKDKKSYASQNKVICMLMQGLGETTVAKWDDLDLPPSSTETKSTGRVSIGYIGDEWDEEYDRGKRKKLRCHTQSFSGPNPFQDVAMKKTQFKKAKMDRSSSGNRPFRI